MKVKFCCILILLISPAILLASHGSVNQVTDSGLTDVLQLILSDPEYQMLSQREKFKLFEALYELVLSHKTAPKLFRKRRNSK